MRPPRSGDRHRRYLGNGLEAVGDKRVWQRGILIRPAGVAPYLPRWRALLPFQFDPGMFRICGANSLVVAHALLAPGIMNAGPRGTGGRIGQRWPLVA